MLVSVAIWLADPAHWQGPDGIPIRTFEHLWISAVSVLVAVAIAMPIGLVIGHSGRGSLLAISMANIGRAVPSYALMVMILPISLSVSPRLGLDVIPTFVAMTVLALPPVLVNTWAGLRQVDRDLVEAARGMGLRERQILRRGQDLDGAGLLAAGPAVRRDVAGRGRRPPRPASRRR